MLATPVVKRKTRSGSPISPRSLPRKGKPDDFSQARKRDKHKFTLSRSRWENRDLIKREAKEGSAQRAAEVKLRTSKFIDSRSLLITPAARQKDKRLNADKDDPSFLPKWAYEMIDEMKFREHHKTEHDDGVRAELIQADLFQYLRLHNLEKYAELNDIYTSDSVAKMLDMDSDSLGTVVKSNFDPDTPPGTPRLSWSVDTPIDTPVSSAPVSPKNTPAPSPMGSATSTPMGSVNSTPRGSIDSTKSEAGSPCDSESGDSADGKHDTDDKMTGDIPTQEDNFPNSDTKGPTRDGATNAGSDTKGQFGFNEFRADPTFEGDRSFNTGPGRDARGDFFNDVQTTDNSRATLRPSFGMEKASTVIPSAEDQILSDLRFDMFDTVNDGFGEGDDNKLFLMEQNRDAKIVHLDPMFAPGAHIGPEAGVGVTSWKLQRTIPTEKMAAYQIQLRKQVSGIRELVADRARDETTNVLGDDIGYNRSSSSKGLKRVRGSIFAPIVSNEMEFSRVKMPSGAELNGYDFRRGTDALRYPRHLASNTNGMGGPTLNTRRSLALIRQ
tara:strand:- start:8984 stop:10645 length:1662 start_codon:yes stop_codon:yes gene_type:complete